jgi:3',5'-cyclic AMP phosphodiesterase CpdA
MKFTRRSFLQLSGTGILAAVMPETAFGDNKSKSESNCSFIQLTDTHVPDESGIERTAKVVEAINKFSLPYDLIIHTGDVSHSHGNAEIMKKAHDLLKFNKKICYVPGNADITFEETEKYEPVFENEFGPCNQSFLVSSNLRFALFNSQAISDRAAESTRQKALDKLKAMLTPSIPTILFCHATGQPDFYENEMHNGWKDDTMNKWTSIMTQGGVFAVLAGHFHRDESHRMGNIPVYICAPVVGWWGRQTAFRHWTLQNGVLTYRTIYIE